MSEPAQHDEPEHTYEEVVDVPPGRPLHRDSPFFRGFFLTLGALAALLVAVAVQAAAAMLVLVLIAAFLAIALEPVVGFVGRRGVPRQWAVLVIGIGSVAVLGTVVYVLGTTLQEQISSLVDNTPDLVKRLRENATVRSLDDRFKILSTIEDEASNPSTVRSALGGAFGFGLGLVNVAVNAVVVYVLMLYFLAARPQITRALYSVVPGSRRERVAALGDEILHRVGRYAIGAFVVALVAGTVTAIFCLSVGLGEYAAALPSSWHCSTWCPWWAPSSVRRRCAWWRWPTRPARSSSR
ncbi:AI-2E family transporter [Jatrophihabitans fulvus]